MKHLPLAEILRTHQGAYDLSTLSLIETLRDIEVLKFDQRGNLRFNSRYSAILSHHPEVVRDVTDMTAILPKDVSIRGRLMWLFEGYVSIPMCRGCGAPTTFNEVAKRWNHYCGSQCSHRDEELMARRRDTIFQRYDAPHQSQSAVCRRKFEQTCQERYGAPHHAKTLPTHFGTMSSSERQIYASKRRRHFDQMRSGASSVSQVRMVPGALELLQNRDGLLREMDAFDGTAIEFSKAIGVTPTTLYRHLKTHGIPPKAWRRRFTQELELLEFIRSITNHPIVHQQPVGDGRSMSDIYIPTLATHIEFDGVHWHGELHNRGRMYHLEKRALDPDARWVSVYDTEWTTRRAVVESRLRQLVGASRRVGARTLSIRELAHSEATNFFNTTHLQGACAHRIAYGLCDRDGTIIAAMSFGAARYAHHEWELLRFSSALNTSAVGGASRLWTHFVRKHTPKSVVSYCDLRTGSGGLYQQLGFTFEAVTPPSYRYFLASEGRSPQLFHRTHFQKHKLKEKLASFDASLSEWENMKRNGYDRIWDVGTARYVWVD